MTMSTSNRRRTPSPSAVDRRLINIDWGQSGTDAQARQRESAPVRRDHGGGIDAARARWGGARSEWIDLSTGVNPVPYPFAPPAAGAWTALPDSDAADALVAAARDLWRPPGTARCLAVPGASAAIAAIPRLRPPGRVRIPGPTYNEHAAAFAAAGWTVTEDGPQDAAVAVHPNNPDGRLHPGAPEADLVVIDESFCDADPGASLIAAAARPGTLVLKSFGKFWGLAGLRLGFVIGDAALVDELARRLGPWPVSGPALAIGAAALADADWADRTRARLAADAERLDALMAPHGALAGGTLLFRLYACDAPRLHERLARARILSRPFPWSDRRLRLGLPAPGDWPRVEAALT